MLEHIFPTSIIDAMARNDALQIVVFAFLFGAACAAIGAKAEPVVTLLRIAGRGDVPLHPVRDVPGAVRRGRGHRRHRGQQRAGRAVRPRQADLHHVRVGGALHSAGAGCRRCFCSAFPPAKFYRAVREPFLIGFSTASSEAALPLALENMEQFGVPKHIVGFVIPTGYSFNLVGSALYLSLASIFVAQAAGMHLSLGEQLLMMLTLMLTSKGVAGVPRAALVILAGTLATFHLPMEGVAVLLGVDALLDMARTGINVLGNCLASAVVARWEGYKVG